MALDAGGKISGSATIIGRTVYLADLGPQHLRAGDLNRAQFFALDTGAFDPAVSDGHDMFLTGYSGLFGLEPRRLRGRREAELDQPRGARTARPGRAGRAASSPR